MPLFILWNVELGCFRVNDLARAKVSSKNAILNAEDALSNVEHCTSKEVIFKFFSEQDLTWKFSRQY